MVTKGKEKIEKTRIVEKNEKCKRIMLQGEKCARKYDRILSKLKEKQKHLKFFDLYHVPQFLMVIVSVNVSEYFTTENIHSRPF